MWRGGGEEKSRVAQVVHCHLCGETFLEGAAARSRTKKELTPGPGQVDTSGDEVTTGDEDADKEEEEVGRRQQHHVFHLCDWNDFQSILFSDFCAIYKDLCKQIIIFVLGC